MRNTKTVLDIIGAVLAAAFSIEEIMSKQHRESHQDDKHRRP